MLFTKIGIYNLFITYFGLIVCAFTLVVVWIGWVGDRIKEFPFILLSLSLLSVTIYNGCLFLLELAKGIPADKMDFRYSLMVWSGFGSFLLGAISLYFISSYFAIEVKPPKRVQVFIQHFLLGLLFIYIATLSILQVRGLLMHVSYDGEYEYGEYAFFGYLSSASFMLIDLILLLIYRKNIPGRQKRFLGFYLFVPLISMLVKSFLNGIYVVALASSFSVLILMLYELGVQAEHRRMQEQKNEQLKVDIMLGQIQPHFLFNVLYVIQEICRTDADKASEAIGDFSKYLRHNMDSLSISTPIPFTQELEHTKKYVSLQQLRFGEALDITFELECTDFYLPTLTLQPIVENAVRYGVRKNVSGKGKVAVRTREYADRYEVEVEDNGPGFDPSAELKDGMSHLGIRNVRERLSRISGGELRIDSTIGVGTTVCMIFPKEEKA